MEELIKRMERKTGRKARILSRNSDEEILSALKSSKGLKRKKDLLGPADGKTSSIKLQGKGSKHKFSAVSTTSDNIRFSSRLEALRYNELKQLQRSGIVVGFLRQVPFHLGSDTVYRVDFQVFWKDGKVTFEDTKGHETESFRTKMRQIADLYPWAEIHLLKKS